MSKSVGKSVTRVDAYDKATGRAKYAGGPVRSKAPWWPGSCHATIAHGYVKSDRHRRRLRPIPGVVQGPDLLRRARVPAFPQRDTPGPRTPPTRTWRTGCCLNRHVRYYGDDIAAVIAEDEMAAAQAVRALKVEYEELPFVLDVQKAMEPRGTHKSTRTAPATS